MAQTPEEFPLATIEELREAFKDVQFPAPRDLLLAHARLSEIGEAAVAALANLPLRTYADLDDVVTMLEREPIEGGEPLSRTHDDPDRESMGQDSILRAERVEEAEEGGGVPGVEHHSGE